MPREWYDKHAANKIEDDEIRALYRKIVVGRKPYFMRYIYPDLAKQYNTYKNNVNISALCDFGMSFDKLASMPYSELTEAQKEFLRYSDMASPVGSNDCVMNRICKKIEGVFDGYVSKQSNEEFDYRFLKNGSVYEDRLYKQIQSKYNDYKRRLQEYEVFTQYERTDDIESYSTIAELHNDFETECLKICPNKATLCNIILDISYSKKITRSFAWNTMSDEIIKNLLAKNNNTITFPTMADDGDIVYGGERFKLVTKCLDDIEEDIDGYSNE